MVLGTGVSYLTLKVGALGVVQVVMDCSGGQKDFPQLGTFLWGREFLQIFPVPNCIQSLKWMWLPIS